jgi:hypothetical protein
LTYIVYKKNSYKSNTTINNSSTGIKINLTRFNPFDDLGGDQSFILCLLDQNDSGVVITSLHNRDNTRLYAKQIKNREGQNISLSKEEKSAILKTIKG